MINLHIVWFFKIKFIKRSGSRSKAGVSIENQFAIYSSPSCGLNRTFSNIPQDEKFVCYRFHSFVQIFYSQSIGPFHQTSTHRSLQFSWVNENILVNLFFVSNKIIIPIRVGKEFDLPWFYFHFRH